MKFLFYGPAIFISFLFLFFLFDHKGTCLENGGVWDEKAKRCRYDCLLWTHKTGCVRLDDAVLAALDRCGHDAKCHDHVLEKVLPGLCRNIKENTIPKVTAAILKKLRIKIFAKQ